MIPQSFIDELIHRADIVDVVGSHVPLKRAGANFLGLCPFHSEKSPSFTVSPSKQFYHCFGCGAHGHAIGFLMEYQGLSFVEAVQDLAQQFGLSVPQETQTPQERERAVAQKAQQATLSEVLGRASRHYCQSLKSSERAITYLKGRGLSGAVCARFGIGYAAPGWRTLASVFPDYDDPRLVESGLVIDKESDADEADATAPKAQGAHKRYDRFRERIMFPIRSVQGEVIGFGGRVLDGSEPKYLNSPETPVFVKGRELYGLYEARSALREKGYALVCEGYMDVVALAQWGFANAVATLGTACTNEHVQKLMRFTERIVFSFDGDAAGRRAASRALVACLPYAQAKRHISFLFLPTEHDPDSFIRAYGSERFEALVQSAVPLSRQLIEEATSLSDMDSAEGRARMLMQAEEWLALMPDSPLREQIIVDVAGRARIEAKELSLRLGRPKPNAAAPVGGSRLSAPRSNAARPAERPGRHARPGTATQLDRAASILLQRCDLWEQLALDAHDLLARQASPHGVFFCALDQILHDEGALAPEALLLALRARLSSLGEHDRDGLETLCQRLGSFHSIQAGAQSAAELQILLHQLRLNEINEQLDVLLATEGLSESALAERQHLIAERAQIKQALPTLQKEAAQSMPD